MGKKYVERGKVLSKLKYIIKAYIPSPSLKERLIKCVTDIPAADVQEVRHGHWVYGEFAIPHCSECGKEIMPNDISPFCPNCGARMDGEL